MLSSRGFFVHESLTRVAKSPFTFRPRLVDSSKIEASISSESLWLSLALESEEPDLELFVGS